NNESELMVPIFMYELKLFKRGGFAPIIDCCARCGDVNNLTSFSVKEGGLLCANCFHTDEHAVQISLNVIKLLPIFMNSRLEKIVTIHMLKSKIAVLSRIIENYYDSYRSYRLKSNRFLEQLACLEE